MNAILSVACPLFMLIHVSVAVAQPPAQVRIDDIIKSWERRQERVRSWEFRWKRDKTVPRGCVLAPGDGLGYDMVLPEATTTFNCSHYYLHQGNHWHYEQRAITLSLINQKNPKIAWQDVIRTTNQDESRTLSRSDDIQYATGFIDRHKPAPEEAKDIVLGTILVAYRPLDGQLGRYKKGPGGLRVTGQQVRVHDRPCVEVSYGTGGPGAVETLWLDRERDFVPLRWTRTYDGKLLQQWDVQEYRLGEVDWMPIAWTDTHMSMNGQIRNSSVCRVLEASLNVQKGPDTFTLAFPKGTVVVDNRTKVEREFLIGQDGKERIITRDEIAGGATYEQLLNSESGMAFHQPQASVSIWTMLTIAFGVLLILAVYLKVRQRVQIQ